MAPDPVALVPTGTSPLCTKQMCLSYTTLRLRRSLGPKPSNVHQQDTRRPVIPGSARPFASMYRFRLRGMFSSS